MQRDGALLRIVRRRLLASSPPLAGAHATIRRPVAAAASLLDVSWQCGCACATSHLAPCDHRAGCQQRLVHVDDPLRLRELDQVEPDAMVKCGQNSSRERDTR